MALLLIFIQACKRKKYINIEKIMKKVLWMRYNNAEKNIYTMCMVLYDGNRWTYKNNKKSYDKLKIY